MTTEHHPTPDSPTAQDPQHDGGARCNGCGTSRRSFLERGALISAVGVASTVGLTACTDDIRAEDNAPSQHVGGTPTEAIQLAELPTGGLTTVKVEGRTLLISRPAEGEVHAFSAVCTHQGCTVAPNVENGEDVFSCPCHGSHFDTTTGVPYGGPAKQPLTEYTAGIDGDWVMVTL
ncbi:ubiquinol-cytochrome c reductase iron-sulfur subunit [Citricoccus nitrophenolicus]|uniref:QcrA and Rieske domain-containing protein n=1 Tax=Citricoccus nitrophenolicus TaxID=863575 RepID=UPI0031E65127